MTPSKLVHSDNSVALLLFLIATLFGLGCNKQTDNQQNEGANKAKDSVAPNSDEPEWAATAREAAEEFSKRTWLLDMSSDAETKTEIEIKQPMSRAEVDKLLEPYVESFEFLSYSTAQDKVTYLLNDGRRLVVVFNYSLPYAKGVLSVRGPE